MKSVFIWMKYQPNQRNFPVSKVINGSISMLEVARSWPVVPRSRCAPPTPCWPECLRPRTRAWRPVTATATALSSSIAARGTLSPSSTTCGRANSSWIETSTRRASTRRRSTSVWSPSCPSSNPWCTPTRDLLTTRPLADEMSSTPSRARPPTGNSVFRGSTSTGRTSPSWTCATSTLSMRASRGATFPARICRFATWRGPTCQGRWWTMRRCWGSRCFVQIWKRLLWGVAILMILLGLMLTWKVSWNLEI